MLDEIGGFPQRCKVCGRVDHMNFHISDKKWKQVIPKQYRTRVVCLSCFDHFASSKGIDYQGIDYHTHIYDVIFVGNAAHFSFDITERRKAMGLMD